ncbi:hypothetical protein WA026_003835 [Henosepilachna vigintioctopunctata]|uniref:Uncharacterized protein n=1 Tax=Henosepilachna vigintioctopunctata TaxID=420089 RepID=A0AAW1UEV5_9CUCU
MSPSPAIPLEVERYIGACLISNHNHQKSKQHNHADGQFYNRDRFPQHRTFYNRGNDDGPRVQRCNSLDGWAGGMPLISFVNKNRNRRPDQQNLTRSTSSGIEDYNLARLAVHTQGAPLILSKTYNHRKNKSQRNQNGPKYPDGSFARTKNGKCETNNNNINFTADTVSVASDESYGSGNSDQCLPRIIKPRKRRKKDRKVPAFETSSTSTDSTEFSSDAASPEIVNPTQYLSFDGTTAVFPDRVFDFYVGVDAETPRLHHTFDEVEDVDDSKGASTSRCQCRYCDPSGQIWDVDKTSYSSFLTPPDRSNVFTCPEFKSSLCREFSRLHVDAAKSAGDEGKDCDDGEQRVPSSDLEVSTEIVTSLNGHRDLEIKFFSTTSADCNSARTCNNRVKNSIDIETC